MKNAERERDSKERWRQREITPAEKSRLARHALMMQQYYDAHEVWCGRVSEACNIDLANGQLDPAAGSEIRDYKDRIAPTDSEPTFRKFLRRGGAKILRNPALWYNDDVRETEKWRYNFWDPESGLRYDRENDTFWYDDCQDFVL
jgi:hypothetical protein